jgi:hypothetical protein
MFFVRTDEGRDNGQTCCTMQRIKLTVIPYEQTYEVDLVLQNSVTFYLKCVHFLKQLSVFEAYLLSYEFFTANRTECCNPFFQQRITESTNVRINL